MSSADKPIGGEAPWRADEETFSYLTDSGRSSIRLILRSGFASKRFLLPDFLCDVVPRVFDELGVSYSFYRVNPDLSIDAASLAGKSFDVLYAVSYFGQKRAYRSLVDDRTWILEDCVFLPVVERPALERRWIGFNSLRKVSCLADGSLVRSTVKLDEGLIAPTEAAFAAVKLQAKRKKWEYLYEGKHSEAEYLREFERGEALVDGQTGIHSISQTSLFQLFDLYRELQQERMARMRNFRVLDRLLFAMRIGLKTEYPCLYVLSVDRRDELRSYLRERRVFLPVHWPNLRGFDNRLYERVISVPVDSRYSGRDMRRIATAIASFYATR